MASMNASLSSVNDWRLPSQVGAFLSWWGNELLSLFSVREKNSDKSIRRTLLVRPDRQMIVVQRVKNGKLGRLRCLPIDADDKTRQTWIPVLAEEQKRALRTTLLLPPECAVMIPLTLPAAAKENLDQVVRFEMDRQTPFRTTDVYYDYRVAETGERNGSIQVELMVVPKKRTETLINSITRLGIEPDAIDIEAQADRDTESSLGFNLLPAERRPQPPRLLTPLNKYLAATVAALLAVVLVIPVLQMYRTAGALEDEAKKLRVEAERVSTLRHSYLQRIEQLQRLAQVKQEKPSNLRILSEMATVLPDDTWLGSLELRNGSIRIQGESDAASKLIGLLEMSPLFERPSFSSPVTQSARTKKEQFVISSVLEGAG